MTPTLTRRVSPVKLGYLVGFAGEAGSEPAQRAEAAAATRFTVHGWRSVTAPVLALDTSRAYFASTPRV
jgi:hypothetical protein